MKVACPSMTIMDVRELRASVRRRVERIVQVLSGVFLNMADLDMAFVRHATEVEYVRRMREILRPDILSESDVVNLSRCCLPCPFSLFYPIREVDTCNQDLELDVLQRSKSLLLGWRNIELFAVPPERQGFVYVAICGNAGVLATFGESPLVSGGYVAKFLLLLACIGHAGYVIDESSAPFGDVEICCTDNRCILPISSVGRCSKIWQFIYVV